MKVSIKRSSSLFILGILIFASACTSSRGTQKLSIELLGSEGNYVSKAYAYKKDGKVIVTGKVKRKNLNTSFGHIDISIISPEDEILEQASTSYTPKVIKRKGTKQSSFTLELPSNPPKGSRIIVAYHPNSSSTDNTFSCAQNVTSEVLSIASASRPVFQTKTNLVDTGFVTLELLPSKKNYISRASVYKDKGMLVISGKVKRKNAGTSLGHVDISVITPEGKILKEETTAYFPEVIKRKGSKESSFTVNMPINPPEGSKIIVRYHTNSSSDDNAVICEQNATSRVSAIASASLPVFQPRVNLVDTGIVTLELLPSKKNYISKAYVHKEKGMLVISGKVKRKNEGSSFGHIDIGIISPEGEILKEISTFYAPRIIKRKGTKESSFKAQIQMIPPTGSKIRIGYHIQ